MTYKQLGFSKKDFKELKEALPKVKLILEKIEPILEKRKNYCDSRGHKKPNQKENYCEWCYQTLVYHTSVDGLEPRKGASYGEKNLFDSTVRRIRKVEITSQRIDDRVRGLTKIAEWMGI